MATGLLNKWAWPDIPGFETFKGEKLHSARWDESIELKDKEVALIGGKLLFLEFFLPPKFCECSNADSVNIGGSTGIQILPSIQPIVKRVDHYMKSKNWISPLGIGGDELIRRGSTTGNFKHSKDELDRFADPKEYANFRHKIEGDINQAPLAAFYGTESQKKFHAMSKKYMEEKLAHRPDILEALMPEWTPGCRRLTPGPGYLEACCEKNVDYVSTPIKRVHEDSIETIDGKIRKVDIIICATGFDV